MKRLITLTGPGGRAMLELTEEGGVTRWTMKPQRGALCLIDGEGRLYRGEGPIPAKALGALVTEGGRVILSGGFTGRSALEIKARQELMLMSAPKRKSGAAPSQGREQPGTAFGQRQGSTGDEGPSCPRQPRSGALMEILEKAAELFPGGQQQPQTSEPEGTAAVNPFPGAFPMSRWRRVEYPGTDRCYLEGEMVRRGAACLIHAIPGEYGVRPRGGYDRFLRGRDGSGYWVKVTRKP